MFITVDDVLNEKKHEEIFGKPEIVVWKDEIDDWWRIMMNNLEIKNEM